MAGISANATLTSDYTWRGQTQSGHESATQGGMDYSHASGFSAGVWASSLGSSAASLGQEVDLIAGYSYKIDDTHSIGLGLTNYTYTQDRSESADWSEYALNYSGKWFDFSYAMTSNYGGIEDDAGSTYIKISKTINCKDTNMGVKLSYGMTSFADEEAIGKTGYSDYYIGVTKTKGDFTAELFHSNTTGRETGTAGSKVSTFTEQEIDSVVGFSLSTTL
jgi:uncharacterized protein (TIGR02001 family)